VSNCKCTGVQHAVGDGCDECVRTCLGCGSHIYEYTDHEYCTPECYVLSNQKEDRWQEEVANEFKLEFESNSCNHNKGEV
jgi:hypothetical protein